MADEQSTTARHKKNNNKINKSKLSFKALPTICNSE